MGLTIKTMSGRASPDDVARALAAAKDKLAEIDPAEAYAAFTRRVSDEEYVRSPRETMLIAAWEAAQSAADIALTDGWHDTDGDHAELRFE